MKIIGHRGAKGLAPENTLHSFHKALEHYADELELDVRVTRDGVVVLHHDPRLADRAGNKLTIRAHTFAKLLLHKPDLLTFEGLLAAVDKDVRLMVEIKPHEPTSRIKAILRSQLAAGRHPGSLCVASFDQSILRAMHAAFPEIQMVVNERWSGVRAQIRARQVGTKRINMRSWWLWSGFLRVMHRAGYQIAPYTMNDPAKVRKWRPYLYGIITDRPDLFEKP